jgi:hypothetical protein
VQRGQIERGRITNKCTLAVQKQPRDGSLTQSEVSPDSVKSELISHCKARYNSHIRAFSIAFHIPYRVLPNSTTISSSASGEGEAAAGCSPADPRFPPARYRSTSARSTRPFFPLPGASSAISTPLSRAKWRTAGKANTSSTAALVAAVTESDDEAPDCHVDALLDSAFGSRGCRRRDTGCLSDVGCRPDSCTSGVSRFCSWGGGGLSTMLVSRCSDVGTSGESVASSSTSMTHKSSPTLATCPS